MPPAFCRKTYITYKNGVWGVAPRQVAGTPVPVFTPGTDAGRVCQKALCKDAYKWSNKVGAGRTDNKRPRLHRCKANQAYTAFHRGEVVWGFGKDAEIERPKALCKDAYKWSNKVGAGRTDNKRPRLQRRKAHKAFL